MSTLTQTEQTTPTPPSATQQLMYCKVGGMYMMMSDGVEKQLIDSRHYLTAIGYITVSINLFGGL